MTFIRPILGSQAGTGDGGGGGGGSNPRVERITFNNLGSGADNGGRYLSFSGRASVFTGFDGVVEPQIILNDRPANEDFQLAEGIYGFEVRGTFDLDSGNHASLKFVIAVRNNDGNIGARVGETGVEYVRTSDPHGVVASGSVLIGSAAQAALRLRLWLQVLSPNTNASFNNGELRLIRYS